MLTRVKGTTSYEDIRTINGVLHPTFKDVCYALGLLDNDKKYIDGIEKRAGGLLLDDARIKDIALAKIENILRTNGRSLRDFPPMPLPNAALLSNMENALLSEELNYDKQALIAQHSTLFGSLTQE
ncbi:ATP-dependent DNA helicase PIF2-like [Senna tora]|uniref:ATP-dependent DNA helicase PIF2-like n=1 Tax=Senna tora TaxID=362788 RepID=A0A834SPA2_9FABA|nr:ATP-dependent DNA helicase PIF2-like [Senna tora]